MTDLPPHFPPIIQELRLYRRGCADARARIGANTAMSTVMNAMLVLPLLYASAEWIGPAREWTLLARSVSNSP